MVSDSKEENICQKRDKYLKKEFHISEVNRVVNYIEGVHVNFVSDPM